MRIISGKFRGKQIVPPRAFRARPTTDFAKEALFNILENHFDIEEIRVLDLFSGTGSISFEFASRGVPFVQAVESDRVHARFIEKTVTELGFDQVVVFHGDVFDYVQHSQERFDIIFVDPPFNLERLETIPNYIFSKSILKNDGWLILEHSGKQEFSSHPFIKDQRKYGSVNFSIFQARNDCPGP